MGDYRMSDTFQAERQLYILSLLCESRRGCSIDRIEEKLDKLGISVSKKTIQRDIDVLSQAFYIYEEMRDNKLYYLAKEYQAKKIIFLPSELISLHFIRELLKSYSFLDMAETAAGLTDKIINALPKVNKAFLDTLRDIIAVSISGILCEKELDKELFITVREAISMNKRLRLSYWSFSNDEITEREFDPYIIEISEGCYHLIGFCHLRSAIRDFRISRIKKAAIIDEGFERPVDFYERFRKDRFKYLTGEEKVSLKIRFNKGIARYIKEYEAGNADKITQLSDGGLLFERCAAMTPDIVKWVLGFGAGAEVLEPASLKEKVLAEARGVLSNYNNAL